ncbi:MAG: HAMP domain-containing histidine kinase [Burkholderiales bacterium]|nr:HAMP domain-containing histidine kinase [Burkholderiales bacterium]
MSHELRTPMHAIVSFAGLGVGKGATAERDKLIGYFSRIRTSADRLLTLLNDLLDLAKLEAGKMTMEWRRHDLNELVRSSVAEAAVVAQSRDITIEFTASEHGLPVNVDGARIQQVLGNLLSNAIKFSHPGGSVEVIAAEEEVDGRVEQVLRVVDHGVGVPEAELEAIFDKFVQSSKTRTGAGGTGLGLSICREIIAAHGGSIRAALNAGGGTRLIVRLPAVAAADAVADDAAAA